MASPQKRRPGLSPMSPSVNGAAPTRLSLLPAFEPVSSSPSLPRPPKRKLEDSPTFDRGRLQHYPTPVPTSSTALLPSSPPAVSATRPSLQRTFSSVSERQPLGTVPFVDLTLDGEFIRMGRSSNSSDFQLSANRLISRVHVRAKYCPPSHEQEAASVLVECLGWNGCKVQCQGKSYELAKGDTFSSTKPLAEILLDVQDARVLIRWPALARKGSVVGLSELPWEEVESPSRRSVSPVLQDMPSSPPEAHVQLRSPVSPSPRGRPALTASSTFLGLPDLSSPVRATVKVYEDASSDEVDEPAHQTHDSTQVVANENLSKNENFEASSPLSEHDEFSDADEENDPLIQSFGIFGENLLPRMASITAASPRRQPLRTSASPQQHRKNNNLSKFEISPIRNHVINQLAFSRLHSLPLSVILKNLPVSMRGPDKNEDSPSNSENRQGPVARHLTAEDLNALLAETACIGEIVREGKDAAGKPLEDEYYYLPELDTDKGRRDAVENSLGKPGIRSVRKQHKQYFWKRPRN